ncbi:SDR family oxidoreductase [Klebsiella variicola]|uniref:SDR family oxidoreductase n=1 Tax=Klebsiella variicola TaxID=244366 RepID=UPI0015EA6497|nr:SDR family oxidoreductase [Klebsiella variicola]QLS59456.1 SDR family oxidoreductase [Klebsiella variicola]
MKVFVTGATGFIGSSITDELKRRGHQIIALARSEESASKLRGKSIEVHLGTIDDRQSIFSVLNRVDGVIHAAFNHNFAQYAKNCADDGALLEAMAQALAGSGKPLIATSGTTVVPPGVLSTEDQEGSPDIARSASEHFQRFSDKGVCTGIIRLPPSVHGEGDTAFIPAAIAIARRTGVSAYIDEGENRWPAVHRHDAARLFCDALERGQPGQRYNAVQDEGIPFRDIAKAIGQGLGIPVKSIPKEEAAAQFGWLAMFAMADVPASSKLTRERLGWVPLEASLLSDLTLPSYFNPAARALGT